MQFSKTFALVALATTASAATCTVDGGATSHWKVRASGVHDIPGFCGGLWDNLNHWGGLCNPSYTYCNGKDGELIWNFTTGTACNRGHIESVWWEATKNEFGSIQCRDEPDKKKREFKA
ncbi:hypothetical protein yc1106_04195 [Curvularia clavata]|uniref:Uncharacterized protein n=1 Tax=Curvularia clavata TaxID=95742 RepID=A0A9Q8Z6X8_CURCL|nr:hypothetical protein yc1106_04195 [Curvularia clavata]